jgi:hypothetical protein
MALAHPTHATIASASAYIKYSTHSTMWFALDRQIQEEKEHRGFPVVPVLLRGADFSPGFLFLNTWIDLRAGVDGQASAEALDALERAIRASGRVQTIAKSGPEAEGRTAGVCTYRGLHQFREVDAAFFVGRRELCERLLEFTSTKNLVGLVGPSGSGKSSLVQAGLLPILRRDRPPAKTWDSVIFTPGKQPFHRLASALIPLLEHDLSETDRLKEAQKLGEGLLLVRLGARLRVQQRYCGTP